MEWTPKRLHLVSEVLMKQWSISVPTNRKQIMAFDLESRESKPAAPAQICYTEDLHPVDSEQFEKTWQDSEVRCAPILKRLNSGTSLNDDSIVVIKDLLALHLIRSFSYWDRHRKRLLGAIENLDLSEMPLDLLIGSYVRRHGGIYPPYVHDRTLVEVEWRNHLKQQFDEGSFTADAMLQMFDFTKNQIANYPLMIVEVGNVRDPFIIGDCPVLPLAGPLGIADEPFGPTVGAYFFPLGPQYAAFTVRNRQDPHLTEREVERFNRLQIENAKRFVVWSPDVDFSHLANSVLN